MSGGDSTGVSEVYNRTVPAILTTSGRFVLNHYGEQIVRLSAGGSVEGRNTTVLDNDYGLMVDQPGKTELTLNYEQRRDKGGTILNPLTESKIAEITDAIDDMLGPVEDRIGRTYEPDLAVQSVTLEVTNGSLQEVTDTTTNVFELRFCSDPADDGIRNRTKFLNEERGLYKQGHNVRNLNLHRLFETTNKFVDERSNPIFAWDGITDIHPKSTSGIAATVLRDHIPDDYGILKQYGVEQENELVLLNDDAEIGGGTSGEPQSQEATDD